MPYWWQKLSQGQTVVVTMYQCPVCGTIRLKLKKIKTAIRNIKLDVDTLRSDSDIKEKFTVAVKNRVSILHDVQEVDEKWEQLKESITQAAEETIPKIREKQRKSG